MASGLVTRRPPRNSEVMPSRFNIEEICGPPPCTTTGWTPQRFMNTMSWAKARFRSSSIMALPPYLITTILPAYVSSQGSASVRMDAFSTRERAEPIW